MADERKDQGRRGLVTGRIEELKRLEAAERALAEAFVDFARAAESGGRLLYLGDRHRQTAALLAERIVALGGTPDEYADDQWILGPPGELKTIVYAVETARRTYHDHLVDLDPETMHLVRDRILPEHERTLEVLSG